MEARCTKTKAFSVQCNERRRFEKLIQFEGLPQDVSGITPVLAPRSGPVVYVNTRGAECFSEHSIRRSLGELKKRSFCFILLRISLFEDADCTRTVYPESAEADGRVVQSNWPLGCPTAQLGSEVGARRILCS